MNLLREMWKIDHEDEKNIRRIKQCLEDRFDWLGDREPESCGLVYEQWCDKTDDMLDIIEMINEFEDVKEDDKREEWDEIRENIEEYQMTHGGLSRLEF